MDSCLCRNDNTKKLACERERESKIQILEITPILIINDKIMEEFNTQEYRDNLAESLKTKRELGEEGGELAKEQLDLEKQTIEYKRAKIQRREDNLVEKQKNTNVVEKSKLPEGISIMEVKTDPEIISAETAISKLKTYGCRFPDEDEADTLFAEIDWKEKDKTSYEIVKITLRQLFGDDYADYRYTCSDIKEKAKEFGLKLVPAALAPEIWMKNPKNESTTNIVMEVAGTHFIFIFNRGSFEAYSGFDEEKWANSDDRFFFLRN